MALFLLLSFIAVPIVEIAVIIKVGGAIGAWQTIGLIVLTAVVGTALVRAQGFALLMRAQETLDRGEFPAAALFEGVSLLAAGLLLLTPGFVTDALGIALLIPPVRRIVARAAWRWLLAHGSVDISGGGRHGHYGKPADDGVIEGEFVEVPQERLPGDDKHGDNGGNGPNRR